MPTVLTHAVVGVGLARVFTARPMPCLYWGLAAGLAMLPDLDVLAFAFGIPYGSRFGHRGFSHSLFCALLVGLLVALATTERFGIRWWLLWLFFFVVMASHGLLDAFTNGGMGIALLSPFDPTRYFFPWRPVQVSPIGLAFFSRWGVRVLLSEFVWIWIPTGVLLAVVLLGRMVIASAK
jgi:inner membrane protein